MATTEETEWTSRDEIASDFMHALITGKTAAGSHAEAEAKPLALMAYQLADAFLAVRNAGGK